MIKKIVSIFKSNKLLMNSFILVITSLIVKILSLINRIIMTRILGTDGISLYVLIVPTIMLFNTISCFSLNISITKLISENEATKEYSQKSILKKGIILSFIFSTLTILSFCLFLHPISYTFLKNKDTFFPLLTSCIFFPISSLNNTLKGYYNGINKIHISSISSLIEEIIRIITIIIIFIFFDMSDKIVGVCYAVLAMIVGELFSLVFQIIKINKLLTSDKAKTIKCKEIINTSLPTLLSRLLGNTTYFLEPIVYTLILSYLNYTSDEITYQYGITNGYILPIISMCSFFSLSISTAILPNISKYYALKEFDKVKYYTNKSIIICLLPAILFSTILKFYCQDYMQLIYGETNGSSLVSIFAYFFIFTYISSPIISTIQAIGKSSIYLKISFYSSIIKIILIIIFSLIPMINFNSLLLSLLTTSIISTFIYYNLLKKEIQITFGLIQIAKIILLIVLAYTTALLINSLKLNYIFSSFIISLLFIIYVKLTNVLKIDNK